MVEALELALKGYGMVSPNPMVGAVVVRDNQVVGRGYHARFGDSHAEVVAIHDAKGKARGATLYVTMEPCCFQGKTPPCTEAIREAGIRRVVVAMVDPNPKVKGEGLRCLRRAGIKTEVGVLEKAARLLNESYITFVTEHRPFVMLKVATTLDGMMATEEGESQWITGEKARAMGQILRLGADAILVGVNSVIIDNPKLTCRIKKEKRLIRVILDTNLQIPLESRLFSEPGPVLIFTSSGGEKKIRGLGRLGAEVVRVRQEGKGRLVWQDVLKELYQREVMSVLIEGGATVISSALEAGVVDRAFFFSSPKILGPGRLFSREMKPKSLKSAIVLRDVRHIELGEDILTEGYVYRFS